MSNSVSVCSSMFMIIPIYISQVYPQYIRFYISLDCLISGGWDCFDIGDINIHRDIVSVGVIYGLFSMVCSENNPSRDMNRDNSEQSIEKSIEILTVAGVPPVIIQSSWMTMT